MNVMIRFMRLFNAKKGKYEIWDTSAISAHLDRLKNTLNDSTSKVKIVITEGVVHELSVGRHRYETCKLAYEFIMRCQSDRLIKVATKDSMRSWTIDEQVVATARKYYRLGYNAKLITCDRDESYKAKLLGITPELLYVPKDKDKDIVITKPTSSIPEEKPKVKESPKIVVEEKIQEKADTKLPLEEFEVPCITKGKQKFIDVNLKIAVYEPNGKRRIGKNDLVPIGMTDKYEYLNTVYGVKAWKAHSITLKRK